VSVIESVPHRAAVCAVQVVRYLAGCGLQSCVMLVRNGYPDIGWNPVEGERYLDFLRFAVFCNGEFTPLSSHSRHTSVPLAVCVCVCVCVCHEHLCCSVC